MGAYCAHASELILSPRRKLRRRLDGNKMRASLEETQRGTFIFVVSE